MNEVTEKVKELHASVFDSNGTVFAFSGDYSNYVTMDIITSELVSVTSSAFKLFFQF